jgi:hypothetical protein
VVENHKPAVAMTILGAIKEYWFLITLVISAAKSVTYMFVFQIDPFDTYREMSQRKQAIAAHLELGQRLLDFGHYKKASSEFAHSLELGPSNLLALEGKRKADLFVQMEHVNWDPGEAMAYVASFPDQNEQDHNIVLFMGK